MMGAAVADHSIVGKIARCVAFLLMVFGLGAASWADDGPDESFGLADESAGVNLQVDTRTAAATGRATSEALILDVTHAGSRLVAVGERGIINYSDDQGASWQQAKVPVNVLLTAVYFADANHGWAVGHDAVILATTDAGATWALQNYAPELDTPLLDVWFADARRGLAVGGTGWVFSTTDGGATWSRREVSAKAEEVDIPDATYDFAPHLFAVAALHDTLFVAGEKGIVMRSDDQGLSWHQLASPYHGTYFGLVSQGEGLLVFGLNGHLFRSSDLGASWIALAGSGTKSLFVAVPMEDERVLLGGAAGTLLEVSPGADAARALPGLDRKDVLGLVATGPGQMLVFSSAGGARRLSGF